MKVRLLKSELMQLYLEREPLNDAILCENYIIMPSSRLLNSWSYFYLFVFIEVILFRSFSYDLRIELILFVWCSFAFVRTLCSCSLIVVFIFFFSLWDFSLFLRILISFYSLWYRVLLYIFFLSLRFSARTVEIFDFSFSIYAFRFFLSSKIFLYFSPFLRYCFFFSWYCSLAFCTFLSCC